MLLNISVKYLVKNIKCQASRPMDPFLQLNLSHVQAYVSNKPMHSIDEEPTLCVN
jgi:hypothetical protein